MKEAQFYRITPEGKAVCELCPQACQLAEGKMGFCKARQYRDGRLFSRNYGLISGLALDPIEKKPLYHYYPGKPILSVGTIGCNLACAFCQNWHISREEAPARAVSIEELVGLAEETHREHGNIGLAYTYSEPTVWFEFLVEVMPAIRAAGLKNVLVTNAFLNLKPWEMLLQWADAANIDLKGFTDEYYQRLCCGKLSPVLDNIRTAAERIHLELTTLIIPGENDIPEMIEALAAWVARIDPEIPLHLSRYYPNERFTLPPTPLAVMERAYTIASGYLKYVYLGNMGKENTTCCPDCGKVWVEREGYRIRLLVRGNHCPGCNRKIKIPMEDSPLAERNKDTKS